MEVENSPSTTRCAYSDALFVQRMRLTMADMDPFDTPMDVLYLFIAIACLESGYGRSRLCCEQNNYFGMKSPKKRTNLNVGNKDFAAYTSRRASVFDFYVWLAMNGFHFLLEKNPDISSFEVVDWIVDKCGYCPDKGYKGKLLVVYNRIKFL